jgi:hypothetical protein
MVNQSTICGRAKDRYASGHNIANHIILEKLGTKIGQASIATKPSPRRNYKVDTFIFVRTSMTVTLCQAVGPG